MIKSKLSAVIGTRTAFKWAAILFSIGHLVGASPVLASNPWGRAAGEAQCLRDVTEDLSNRAHRLFPSAPATAITCVLDESACRLREMVKCGADWNPLQGELQLFQGLQTQLCQTVTHDPCVARDRSIQNYLRMVDDRYGDLVRDLSKCKPPMPSCNSPYPTHYHPSGLTPYAQSSYGVYPTIPQPLQPRPAYPNDRDPHNMNPNGYPSAPQYWQGSLPGDSHFPRSTYDYESLPSNRTDRVTNYASNLNSSEHPVAAEILSLLLSRSMR